MIKDLVCFIYKDGSVIAEGFVEGRRFDTFRGKRFDDTDFDSDKVGKMILDESDAKLLEV